MVIMALNLCRVCLKDGAQISLFEKNYYEDSDLLKKLEFCMNDKITDIKGYPQRICTTCKDALDDIYRFIRRFKDTCYILQNNLLMKLEQLDFSDDSYGGQIEVAIKKESIKIESSDDELLSEIQKVDVKHEQKTECLLSSESKINAKRIRQLKKRNVTSTNSIASSLLEGEFMWIGDTWCIKPKKLSMTVKKEKPIIKQKRIQIKLPKVKIKNEEVQKLCDLCGMTFKRQDRLAVHKKKVHFQKSCKCPHCPQVLCSDYYLNRHIMRCHHKEKKFPCPTCGRAFAYKGELTGHIRNVHNKHLKTKKQYACKLCDKVFKCNKSVIVHERSAHTGYRPAVCTVCDSSFFHEDYLKEHMRLHTGETPFKCPICGRGYAQRCNMKSHLRIHRKSEIDPNILSKLRPNYLKLLKP